MKRIESFCVNHDKLTPDVPFPHRRRYCHLRRAHGNPECRCLIWKMTASTFRASVCHLCAQYRRFGQHPLRRSDGLPHRIFYFITRDKISKARAIELVQETCAFIEHFEGKSPAPAASSAETSVDHSLPKKQNSTPITLPKHWLAGRRKRWSISFKFFFC